MDVSCPIGPINCSEEKNIFASMLGKTIIILKKALT